MPELAGSILFLGGFYRALCLFDAGFLAGEVTQVENPCPADFTNLVDFDFVDEGGFVGENSLDTHSAGNLANGEGAGERAAALDLNHGTTEFLETIFVAFFDSVGNGDGVTCLELGVFRRFVAGERVLYQFDSVHNTS